MRNPRQTNPAETPTDRGPTVVTAPYTDTIRQLLAAATLAILLSGCDGSGQFRNPTAPGEPPAPAPPGATYTLSGTVTEMTSTGPVAVAGVRVEDASAHEYAITDATGFYSVTGLRAAISSISASKSGYVSGQKTVTISSDTRLDIQLERIVSYTLSGMVFGVTPTGRVPIVGVELYCDSCGSPEGHTFVYSDADGLYSFSWAFNGVTPLFVTKPGYAIVDPTGTSIDRLGRLNITVNGDTRFDIQLAPK
jgi:Carboxypeptidase regulatory-like domain